MMRNKKVLFYSSVKDKESFKLVQFYNIDITILKDLGYEVLLSNSIADAWKFWKYDFVFAYFYRYSFFVALIARIFGKRSYFTGGIDSLNQNNIGTRDYNIQSILFKLCYSICCRAIVVSQTDMENIKAIVRNTKKLAYSEHTIPVDKYHADIKQKKEIFVTIGWTAISSIERKGIDKAIKVFAKLQSYSEFSNSKLVLAGTPGDGEGYLLQLIKDNNIEDKVDIRGNISEEEKIHLLEDAKYYFQLSSFEGFGLAALEAVCAKCILIHSGRGGLSNPIYKDEILINIDGELDSEAKLLYTRLLQFDDKKIESSYKRVLDNYGNERRKKEFEQIL